MSEQIHREVAKLPKGVTRPIRVGFIVIFSAIAAFTIWATHAPLSTSIHAAGYLNAANPSFDIQHPFGGDIAAIYVREHDVVEAGQALLAFDVENAKAQRRELEATLLPLRQELDVLDIVLVEGVGEALRDLTEYANLSEERVKNMQAVLRMQREVGQATETAFLQRAEGIEKSMAARLNQRESMHARLERYRILVENGALRVSENDVLLEEILELEASLEAERAEIQSLRNQAVQTRTQTARELLEFRQNLLDRKAQLVETIPKLRLEILRLNAMIDQSEISAPEAGVVTRLHYPTDEMFVQRGQTVLTLTRLTQDHTVSFRVSPHLIDQVRAGMTGVLTITSLSQRNHPRVEVQIQSLSPDARRDSEGTILGYDGVAKIDAQALDHLLLELAGDVSLVNDMPINLVFEGREITFGAYLLGPFWEFLSMALQD